MKTLAECSVYDEKRYNRVNATLNQLKVEEREITVHPQEAAIIETCNWSSLAGRAYAADATANLSVLCCIVFAVLAVVAYFAPGIVTAGILAVFALLFFRDQRVNRDKAVLALYLADKAANNVSEAHGMMNIDPYQDKDYTFTIRWGEKKMRDDFELGDTYEIGELYKEARENRRPSSYDFE